MENRDFKGVWIPKELWLNEDLTLLEKVIYVEIDSLDNEDHCVAGNEYFAKFCNCSESKVTKAIKRLQELDMIEVVSFDGRHRKLRVVKSTRQTRKKYEAESEKVRPNNINNNTNNKDNTLSKDKVGFDLKHSPKKSSKSNVYNDCVNEINLFTGNETVRQELTNYLKMRIKLKGLTLKGWQGILKNFKERVTEKDYISAIQYSISKEYRGIFNAPDDTNQNNRKFNDYMVKDHTNRFENHDISDETY